MNRISIVLAFVTLLIMAALLLMVVQDPQDDFSAGIPELKAESEMAKKIVAADDKSINIVGRYAIASDGGILFGYPGVSLEFEYEGKALSLLASSSTGNAFLDYSVDGGDFRSLRVPEQNTELSLQVDGEIMRHRIKIVNRSETWLGVHHISHFLITGGDVSPQDFAVAKRKILIVGDSVTCGEAVARDEQCQGDAHSWNPRKSYGMLLAEKFKAQVHLVCYGGRGLIRDWQGSTDVQNAPAFFNEAVVLGDKSLPWDHSRYQPDLILISLGTNDFNLQLGALPEREVFVSSYVSFIDKILNNYPLASIAITEGAMVTDRADPQRPARSVLREYLGEVVERIGLPTVHVVESEYYPGDDCNAHPTAAQHEKMATDLFRSLKSLTGWW